MLLLILLWTGCVWVLAAGLLAWIPPLAIVGGVGLVLFTFLGVLRYRRARRR